MANEYFVNSADLTYVADAIRAKGETTEQIVFPDGFVAAIAGMETGKTGATLTVTTPAEGITVTVSKGELSYTKTTGADGAAVFSGLESGTWTITISDGSQTATGTVNIDADYAAELTFFAATINVTYPAGLVCTATDGVTTLTAPDTSGTWVCVVRNAGTWTVSLGNGLYETVEIAQNGETQTVDKWYLYKAGDERTAVTGGWSIGHQTGQNTPNIGKCTKASTYIQLSTENTGVSVYITNPIDLTNCNTVHLNVLSVANSVNWRYSAGVTEEIVSDGQYTNAGYANITSAGEYTIDITELSGYYYIYVGLWSYDGQTMKFDKVWID